MNLVDIILQFKITQMKIGQSIITTWLLMLLLLVFALVTRRLLTNKLNRFQVIVEGAIIAMQNAIEAVLPTHVELVFPFIATLWIFIFFANLIGIIPGLSSPTADLSVTSALAIIVFVSVHWFGIKAEGARNYLKHYLTPSPIMLPFHIISEITRTLALAVRLFGNMMSLELTVLIILMVAGFLVPVPILMLHIIEACVQTYIFGMLALIYIAGGIQSHQLKSNKLNNLIEEKS